MDDQRRFGDESAGGSAGPESGLKSGPNAAVEDLGPEAPPALDVGSVTPPDPRHDPGDAPIGTLDLLQMAVERDRGAPADDTARRVLIRHERLLAAQTAQLGRQRWRDYVIAVLVVGLVGLSGLFVWDASRARGVVVEPFAIPPDLVARGLTGPVVASHLLDRLATLQAETSSIRAPSTYANDWGGDIAVEIPSTGVSIGELRRYLRQWLGHQTRLSGEVVRLPDGRLAVTTRVGARPATRIEGPEAELDALLQQGAESIHAQTQPYRHAVWLLRGKASAEQGAAAMQALTRSGDLNDRLWAYAGVAGLSDDPAVAERYLQAALRLDPDFFVARFNLAANSYNEGREARAHRLVTRIAADPAAARRQLAPGRAPAMLAQMAILKAELEGDMAGAARMAEAAIGLPTSEINEAVAPLTAVYSHARAHDLPAARRVLRQNGLDTPEAIAERLELLGPDYDYSSLFSASTGDERASRDRMAATLVQMQAAGNSDESGIIRADLAAAHARLGEIDVARAVIAPTPLYCVACVRARGLIEAYAGNPRGADHWLSEAVRIAPTLPAAHLAWAEAWLVRRDPERAIAQLELAVQKGPRWADPRKLWGDALMMQGRPAQAVARYEEAAALAPRWGRLHAALGRARAAAGDRAGALDSFRTAAALDLNPADRADVTRRLASEGARRASR